MKERLYNTALLLSVITILYNIVEGGISVFFGIQDETLALFGFGADSFVEVMSGVGIAHMILRMKRSGTEVVARDRFEWTALKVTGTAFYLLTAGLIIGAVLTVIEGRSPDTTLVGVIISLISIITMYFLMHYKLKVGHQLDSRAVIADANCTRACFYLSFILLASSGLYELFHILYIDTAGALGIAWYAFREGREAWEDAGEDTEKELE
ncbi:MAG: cation transporter [Balneolaceae bacterium]|nr:cation transporter [Balneolaceae bacterium]